MKIESRNTLLQKDGFILESVRNLIRSSRLNEETQLRDTSQGWFKESLAVYFTTMTTDDQISKVEKKLSFDDYDQLKVKLKLPNITDFRQYGSNAEKTISDAIKHLVEDVVLKTEKKFYYNAISIAKLLRKIYGGKIDPKKVDMGDDYGQIRTNAVKIAAGMSKELGSITADKWCPADMFIYNDLSDITRAKSAKFLNVDVGNDFCLNGLFQSNPESDTSKGIFAISLKEQASQGGAATSFKNILTKPENFPDVGKIENIDALSIIYHLENFISYYSDPKSTPSFYFSNLSYAHASAKKLIARRSDSSEITKSANKVIDLIEYIFKSTLGDKTPPKTAPRKGKEGGKYDSKKLIDAFQQANISEFKVPKGTKELVDSVSKQIADAAIDEYQKLRKEFLKNLKTAGYNPPIKSPKLDEMDVKYTLSKAGCYKTASYVLKNMSSGVMTIPKEFSTIAEQKNIFVAMTAYAVGLSGISPTFFKVRGSDKPSGVAHMEPFYGNGFFHLDDDSQIEIEDNPGNAGFMIKFISKVTRNKDKNSETVAKYETKMEYRSVGEQITVQVKKLDPFKNA